jgi:hypothetical protein
MSTRMGDSPYSGPVELPARVVLPATGRRRHRLVTGTSGVLLFVCIFLPAVKGCNEPIVPLEVVPFWVPYLYGLAFAMIALVRSARAHEIAAVALRVLAWLVLVGACSVIPFVPQIGIPEVLLALVLIALVGWNSGERRFAITALVVGVASAAWFALWCLSPDALTGVYLSLASALGLVAGAIVWLVDLARPAVPAVAIVRKAA